MSMFECRVRVREERRIMKRREETSAEVREIFTGLPARTPNKYDVRNVFRSQSVRRRFQVSCDWAGATVIHMFVFSRLVLCEPFCLGVLL